MRALRIHKFTPNAPLKLDDVPVPTACANEVLIAVKAAGVNPVDSYVASSGGFIGIPPLPFTGGFDGAGVVEAVGAKVTKFKPGDRVFFFGTCIGSFAEKVVVPESGVGHIGDGIELEQGAALGVPYLTAYRALFQLGLAKAGETVLVHGASGGVGIAATQLAKHAGLTVIGTAGSAEGIELVKGVGTADFAFNHSDPQYLEQIKATIKSPINLIIENVANVNLKKDIDIIGQRGRIVVVGSRAELSWNPASLFFKEISVHGMCLSTAPADEIAKAIEGVGAGTAKGGCVRPVVYKRYTLTDGPGGGNDALADVLSQSGGARGKLVIVP